MTFFPVLDYLPDELCEIFIWLEARHFTASWQFVVKNWMAKYIFEKYM